MRVGIRRGVRPPPWFSAHCKQAQSVNEHFKSNEQDFVPQTAQNEQDLPRIPSSAERGGIPSLGGAESSDDDHWRLLSHGGAERERKAAEGNQHSLYTVVSPLEIPLRFPGYFDAL